MGRIPKIGLEQLSVLNAIAKAGSTICFPEAPLQADCERLLRHKLLQSHSFVDGKSRVGQATITIGYTATAAGRVLLESAVRAGVRIPEAKQ